MVFKRKLDDNGKVCGYNSRLVEKVFSQKEGVEYFEVFALVVPYEVLLLFEGKLMSEG